MTTTEAQPGTAKPEPKHFVGQAIRRKEDPRLITGRATYTDDITFPGMLYAAIVRSTEAHARITSIDTAEAEQHPGVAAVFTGADLEGVEAPIPMVCRSFTRTIAFEATCLHTRQAKTRSPHCGSVSSPATSSQVSRSSISPSASCTSIPPSTRL